MSSWMVYTLGDSGFFASLFNAIAMIFGSDAFKGDDGDYGGTLIYLAFLFALIAALMNGLTNQWKSGNNPVMLLVLFIVWMVGGYTKATVIIEDIYSGSSRAVDNVPLMVAVPTSLITTVAMELGRLSQTAFQAADANATELTTEGFINPLKLMLSVRQAASYSPHMTQNWGGFIRNCMIGASSPQQLLSSTDGVYGALMNAANLTAHRHTNYYTASAVSPVVMSCADAGPQIHSDFVTYFNETNPALNRAMRDATGRNSTSTDKTWTDLSNFYATNSTLSGLSAQRTSANIMMHHTTSDVFKCGNNSSDPTAYFQCTQVLSGQQQAFTVDAAAGGAGFTRTVITSMGFLLAIFIGLAPLVMIVALMSGANALPLLGKYVLFGAWTQSWLPAAYMVNYFIVYTWTESMANLKKMFLPVPAPANAALPIEAVPLFFSETMDKIAVASDLLAAVPLITLAAMTGSYFALAKLGERWSGKDYSDEKMAAPSLSNVGAVSSNSTIAEYSPGAGGQMSGAKRVSYNMQDSLNAAVTDKQAEALQVQKQVSREFGESGRFQQGWDRAVATAKRDGSQASSAWAQAVLFADKHTQGDSFGHGLTKSDREEVKAQLQGGVGAMLAGFGAKGLVAGDVSNLSATQRQWATQTTEGKEWLKSVKDEFSKNQFSSLESSDTITDRMGFTKEEALQFKESMSRLSSTTKAHEEATQLASGIGASYAGTTSDLDRRFRDDDAVALMLKGRHAALADDKNMSPEAQRYREEHAKVVRQDQADLVPAGHSEYGQIYAAMARSGMHDDVMNLARSIVGGSNLDTPDINQFAGVGDSVPTPNLDANPSLGAFADNHPQRPPSHAVPTSTKLQGAAAENGRGSSISAVPAPSGAPIPVKPAHGTDASGNHLVNRAGNIFGETYVQPAGAALGNAAAASVSAIGQSATHAADAVRGAWNTITGNTVIQEPPAQNPRVEQIPR